MRQPALASRASLERGGKKTWRECFRILKRVFEFVKVRSRGLKKNHDHLYAVFALVNLYLHRGGLALLGA